MLKLKEKQFFWEDLYGLYDESICKRQNIYCK